MTFQIFQTSKRPALRMMLIHGVVLSCCLSLAGCRSDRVNVNAKDPDSPQFAYRLDELALLQMAADDIQELERKKQYGQIYDNFASDNFKAGVSRRRFMIMANCVETNLGGLQEFDRNDIGFRREWVKAAKGGQYPLDVLNRLIQRDRGTVEEQLIFITSGFNFKLNGLYWISKDEPFLQCIANSPQVEASTEPKVETPQESTTSEETTTTKASDTESKNASETASQSETSKEATSSESTAPSGSSPAQTDGLRPVATPLPLPGAPVQEMKPSEQHKKEPLQARPAGAGAVVDTRPTPKKPSAAKDTKSTTSSTPKAEESVPLRPATERRAPVPGSSGGHTSDSDSNSTPPTPDSAQ